MSLWKKTKDNPLSAPVWYARHCYFDGTMVVSGKVDLKNANTQFEVGDALLYVASSAMGGLTTNTVYYVKEKSGTQYVLSATRGGDAITVTATAASTTQMFIKCDTYETTNDGVLNYAIIPVSVADAKSEKYGKTFNAPGWWRYRRFTKAGQTTATVHGEMLVSLKGDFDEEVPTGGEINDPTANLSYGTLQLPASDTNVKVTGKSIRVNNLLASNVKGYVTMTGASGDVVVGGAQLVAAPLQVTAN